jgi:hypothetical protein
MSNEDWIVDEAYRATPEENARLDRAQAVWEKWKDATITGHEFTKLQESVILNMLFRMQEAEHAHFGIKIPKGEFVNADR